MIKIITILLTSLWIMPAWSTPTPEQPDRSVEDYNLEAGSLGLKGYDPVGYFQEHGGKALKGNKEISTIYGGVTYYFASKENRDIFLSAPTKYEPTYGGWCAWAMANEGYFDIDPVIFTQHGDRMHFFISQGAKTNFDNDLEFHEQNADDFWEDETGESPRI